jgi:hypothetical protein
MLYFLLKINQKAIPYLKNSCNAGTGSVGGVIIPAKTMCKKWL